MQFMASAVKKLRCRDALLFLMVRFGNTDNLGLESIDLEV